MKNTLKILGLFALTLAILALVGLYRSQIDQTPYPLAFDQVVNGFASGIWELLRSPIVLTGIMVGIGLWIFRKAFPDIISRITELSAGGISAKLSTSELILSEISKDVNGTYLSAEHNNVKVLEIVVEHLGVVTLEYLFRVNGKELFTKEHYAIIAEGLSMNDSDWQSKEDGASGFLLAMILNFRRLLFDLKFSHGVKKITITLKPQVLHLIKKRLNLD